MKWTLNGIAVYGIALKKEFNRFSKRIEFEELLSNDQITLYTVWRKVRLI